MTVFFSQARVLMEEERRRAEEMRTQAEELKRAQDEEKWKLVRLLSFFLPSLLPPLIVSSPIHLLLFQLITQGK